MSGPPNIAGLADAAAAGAPERAALVVVDDVWTYGELVAASRALASRLRECGIGPGDRVALVAWGGGLAVAGTLACAHVGAAAAPMNPLLTAAELTQLATVAGCRPVGIAAAPYQDALAEALQATTVLGDGDLAAREGPPPPVVGGGDDDALVLFTSGTTGLPKAVPITHAAIGQRIGAYRQPFDPGAPPNVGMMCVPAFHVGGLLGLLLNLYSGDSTVVQPRFDAGQWLALVERHRIASTFVVPTMLQRILDHPEFATTDLSSLTAVAYGAAAAPVELVRRAVAALPHVAFANVFGQTETLGAYTTLGPADHRDPARIGSVGRPLPGVEIRIVDPDTGGDAPAGSVGELWVLAPQNVQPGWLRTGDLARQDGDGYIYPSGRMSDTINRGGEKFGPEEVATVIRRHPRVAEAAVAGIRDPEMGERVGAAVVRRGAVTAVDLREFCREHLASFKLPEVIVFVDALPYNELGKLSRKATAALIERERDATREEG